MATPPTPAATQADNAPPTSDANSQETATPADAAPAQEGTQQETFEQYTAVIALALMQSGADTLSELNLKLDPATDDVTVTGTSDKGAINLTIPAAEQAQWIAENMGVEESGEDASGDMPEPPPDGANPSEGA